MIYFILRCYKRKCLNNRIIIKHHVYHVRKLWNIFIIVEHHNCITIGQYIRKHQWLFHGLILQKRHRFHFAGQYFTTFLREMTYSPLGTNSRTCPWKSLPYRRENIILHAINISRYFFLSHSSSQNNNCCGPTAFPFKLIHCENW